MAVKKSTNNKNVKLTTQTTTAPKSSTTTIGSRPYSSPNASSANRGTTAVNKGTNTTATKIATPTAATTPNKSTNTTASKVVNTAPTTAAKVENTTPTMNTANETVNKGSNYTSLPYTTPNANLYNTANTASKPASTAPLAAALSAVGGLQTAAANATPYAVAPAVTAGSVLPAAADVLTGSDSSNLVNSGSSSDTPGLFDSIMKSYAIAGTANTDPISNVLGNTNAARLNATRPYSNPNYGYEEEEDTSGHHGGGGGHAFGDSNSSDLGLLLGMSSTKSPEIPEGNRKGNIGEAIAEEIALNDLLDTLSAEVPGASPYSPYASSGSSNRTNGGDVNYGGSSSSSSSSSSGGGGTRGIGGSTGSVGLGDYVGDLDISALYDLLNQRLGEYDVNYTTLLDLLANNYGDLLNSLGINYSDTEALLNNQFTNSKNELEAARRRALQEAYISRMMQEKNLADQLDAYGLTGGASESVLANINNNYANNRYRVEENLQNNLRDLLQKYLENLSGARERYNNSLMNAQNNRYNALVDAAQTRTNARANAYEDLYNTLANLTMKGIRYGG